MGLRVLEEEKTTLEKRIELYERERRSAESTFQPIIQEANEQIKSLIQEKNQLLSMNAEHARSISELEMSVSDLKEKNVRLIEILNKQRREEEGRERGRVEG